MARLVAIATPATSSLNTITSTIFKPTFIKPDTKRAYKGLLVSPTDLKTADPKLYIIIKGIPKKYIFKYRVARSITSPGVPISNSIGLAINWPDTNNTKPLTIAILMVVCTASCTFSFLFCPM